MDVAARWGDSVNGGDGLTGKGSVEALRSAIGEACERVGRDPGTIGLTGWSRIAPWDDPRAGLDRRDTIAGPPEAVAERLLEIATAGATDVTCFIRDPDDGREFPLLTERALERFARVLELVRAG